MSLLFLLSPVWNKISLFHQCELTEILTDYCLKYNWQSQHFVSVVRISLLVAFLRLMISVSLLLVKWHWRCLLLMCCFLSIAQSLWLNRWSICSCGSMNWIFFGGVSLLNANFLYIAFDRFQYILLAATSPVTKLNEETLTYLNQGMSIHCVLQLSLLW